MQMTTAELELHGKFGLADGPWSYSSAAIQIDYDEIVTGSVW